MKPRRYKCQPSPVGHGLLRSSKPWQTVHNADRLEFPLELTVPKKRKNSWFVEFCLKKYVKIILTMWFGLWIKETFQYKYQFDIKTLLTIHNHRSWNFLQQFHRLDVYQDFWKFCRRESWQLTRLIVASKYFGLVALRESTSVSKSWLLCNVTTYMQWRICPVQSWGGVDPWAESLNLFHQV